MFLSAYYYIKYNPHNPAKIITENKYIPFISIVPSPVTDNKRGEVITETIIDLPIKNKVKSDPYYLSRETESSNE